MLSKKNLLNDNGMPSKVKIMALFEGLQQAQEDVSVCEEKVKRANQRELGQ